MKLLSYTAVGFSLIVLLGLVYTLLAEKSIEESKVKYLELHKAYSEGNVTNVSSDFDPIVLSMTDQEVDSSLTHLIKGIEDYNQIVASFKENPFTVQRFTTYCNRMLIDTNLYSSIFKENGCNSNYLFCMDDHPDQSASIDSAHCDLCKQLIFTECFQKLKDRVLKWQNTGSFSVNSFLLPSKFQLSDSELTGFKLLFYINVVFILLLVIQGNAVRTEYNALEDAERMNPGEKRFNITIGAISIPLMLTLFIIAVVVSWPDKFSWWLIAAIVAVAGSFAMYLYNYYPVIKSIVSWVKKLKIFQRVKKQKATNK